MSDAAAPSLTTLDRFRGSILGLAIGDALGHPTEFVSTLAGIRARWGEKGVTDFESAGRHPPGTFTDDTQMSIAVARALIRAGQLDLDTLMTVMAEEFVAWYRSPQNNRSPGGTCLTGCRMLESGVAWREAGVKGSKGCGAAMRAAPIGLYFHGDTDAMIRVAAAQSVLTHAHPTGIASSVAAAAPVAWATQGKGLEGMLDYTRECVERLGPELLAELGCEARLIEDVGNREMLEALERVQAALPREAEDVCQLLGGGWIGEEAVAGALWCVLKSHGDFSRSVLSGANSSGDSDSLACIAGSVSGAYGGLAAIPQTWTERVEKTTILDLLARSLHEAVSVPQDDEKRRLEPDQELDVYGVKAVRGAGS